jgi:hypothetical protein
MSEKGKPSLDQIVWVLNKLSDHLTEGGNFRTLVERFGYGLEAYEVLMAAGGMELANVLDWAATMEQVSDANGLDFSDLISSPDDKKKDGKPN